MKQSTSKSTIRPYNENDSITLKYYTLKRLLPALILFIISCDDDVDPLVTKLTGTSWEFEKMELIDTDGNISRTIAVNDSQSGPQKLAFLNKETIFFYYDNDQYNKGCGQWAIENGRIKIALTIGQIVPGLCHVNNFSMQFISRGTDIDVSDDRLILHEIGFYDNFGHVDDWEDIQDQIRSGKLKMRSYYKRSNNPAFEPDTSCCGRFEWF
jgi:hypothetical protein